MGNEFPGVGPRVLPIQNQSEMVHLSHWMNCIDEHLAVGDLEAARIALQGLMAQRPWHLAAYERALDLTWRYANLEECKSFALRLLQADPLNVLACQMLASVGERKGDDDQDEAVHFWQRLWQMHPFVTEYRSRWLAIHGDLMLDLPALGFTHLHSRHWREAALVFAELAERFPEREDWYAAWLICAWRNYQRSEVLAAGRSLVQRNRFFLAGWYILSLVGDDADQAIASTYISLLDPDGSLAPTMVGLGFVPVESTVPQLEVPGTHRMLRRSLKLEESPTA